MYHFVYEYYQIKDNLHKKKLWKKYEKKKIVETLIKCNKKQEVLAKLYLFRRVHKDCGISKQNAVCALTGRPRGIVHPFQLKRQILKEVLKVNKITNLERKKN